MNTFIMRGFALFFLVLHSAFVISAHAQVPQLLNYQGRVAVGTVNFDGSGSFKFALVNTDGTTTYWSNDGTSTAGSQPTAAVLLTVTKGLYSVLLGDTSLANMTAIPASVWTNADENEALKEQLADLKAKDAARDAREKERDAKLAAIEALLRASAAPAVRTAVFKNAK